jgi:hypothetical protein
MYVPAFTSVELLIKVAELFRELMRTVKEIDDLPEKDRTTIKAVLNTFIIKNKFQRLASETENKQVIAD